MRTTGRYASFHVLVTRVEPDKTTLQAHDAAISKVSWAHPEFGTIIASASFDRTVKVWEQTSYVEIEQPQVNGASGGPSTSSRWTERAILPEAKGTVRSVEFAPQHFGLKLVSPNPIVFGPSVRYAHFRSVEK